MYKTGKDQTGFENLSGLVSRVGCSLSQPDQYQSDFRVVGKRVFPRENET